MKTTILSYRTLNFFVLPVKILAQLPDWLDLTSVSLPSVAGFFNEMGRTLDPVAYEVLEENLSLLPGESAAARTYTDCLWSVVQAVPDNS